ncbi:HlyD family type I secretion periplasmic adaptor subunit [Sulfitobacter sp.]|uniref:HlyD family type I secretion periplasmic adaptor subunit n=1 Tax=Sulfitobacter sp. TaxID=1903071 RepID=UPI003567A535|tara:strand:+ start:619 stop:1932 length:1314 start_codon:yes stop_codon:yes gene_type:complete
MVALPNQGPTLRTGLRWTGVLGVVATIALLGGGTFWAATTQISGAVIASGSVEVIGRPKSVQHLDGGIIDELRVVDGDFVTQGDVLVRLDDTNLLANLSIYRTRLSEVLALKDRLVAEQREAATITRAPLDLLIGDVDFALHQIGQAEIFEARQEFEQGRKEQLDEKIRQFENQTIGVNALIDAKQQQLALLEDELGAQKTLFDKGLARSSQLLSLQRSQADLLGQIAEHQSELARIQNSVRDTELELLQGARQKKEEVVTQLREVTTNIQELRQQIVSTEKQLDRVAIRAPNTGRIHEMAFTTIGGVIPPGGTILKIIPQGEGFGIRTRIDPASVDQVYVGQPAKVRFPAFNQRTTPELLGSVHDVSATTSVDDVTGQSFYGVEITVPEAELARLADLQLVPGMPVEAYITTTDRTVLSYLLKPLRDQLNQAFREE